MSYKKFLIVGLFMVLVCGCQHSASTLKGDEPKIQTIQNDNDQLDGVDITGLGDPLESRIEVQVGSIGMNIKGGANFFRGYIDKTTVTPDYQLYIQTKEGEYRNWDKAKYLSPEGLREYSVKRVGADAKCSQWGCAYYEDIVLHIDKQVLENWRVKETIVRLTSSTVSGNKDIEVSEEDTKIFLNAMDKLTSYLKAKQTPRLE